jgi:hypothetical protein
MVGSSVAPDLRPGPEKSKKKKKKSDGARLPALGSLFSSLKYSDWSSLLLQFLVPFLSPPVTGLLQFFF